MNRQTPHLLLALAVLLAAGALLHAHSPDDETSRVEQVEEIEAAFDRLREATVFAAHGVGYAGTIPPEHADVRMLVAAPNASNRLQELVRIGSPAAKLYAMAGLWRVDRNAFRAAVSKYRESNLIVEFGQGCIIMQYRLHKIIGDSPVPANGEGVDKDAPYDLSSGRMAAAILTPPPA